MPSQNLPTQHLSLQNLDNVILGIGNKALSDDAAGIKVVRYMLKNFPHISSLQIIDGGNLTYELTTVLESAQNLLVIDAAKLEQAPGTITLFEGTQMDEILKRPRRNANETALADMIEIARLAKKMPRNRALLTIEPKKTSWGNRMSACVSKAIPQLAQNALTLMSQWTGTDWQEAEPSAPLATQQAPT
ncbi:MAG: hypothetical protein AMJ53_07560 [Gammaproteobacteria bacterium SG8_11]|nr:MAG: hypothetical protein AMJ53_07560 [Gammaproteobacteria bacterium SG8_11]